MEKSMTADYRDQLKSELSRRKMSNPSYSLRAFAKALELSPAFLSKVLSGGKDLSLETAALIAERLGYNTGEATQFCRLVQISKSSSPVVQQSLSQGLAYEEHSSEYHSLDLEAFQVISDWYHYAILELSSCDGQKLTPDWASRRLGIPTDKAKTAINRLIRLGLLISLRGRLVKSRSFLATPSDRPNRAIRNFHTQMIEKAKQSIEGQKVELRDISGMTFPISADKVEIAKKEIKAFRRKMAKLLDSSRPTEVYQLNIQFFSLTQASSKSKSESEET